MSGSNTDSTQLVLTDQERNRALYAILTALQGGVTVNQSLPVYTVASLPATAAIGQLAYASNGRKSGQGAGLGTGVPVIFDATNLWFALWSSAIVTV